MWREKKVRFRFKNFFILFLKFYQTNLFMKIICRRSKTVFCFCLLWYRRSKSRLMLWAFTGRFRPRKQLSVVHFKGPSGKSRGNLFMIFHQRSFRMKTIRILQNSRAIAAETKRLTQKFPRFLKQQFIVSGWMRNYITNISTFRAEAAGKLSNESELSPHSGNSKSFSRYLKIPHFKCFNQTQALKHSI